MKNHYYLFSIFQSPFYSCSRTRLHSIFRYFINSSDCFESKIQTELQTLLKHDYLKFQSNFDNYSAPYLLKTDEALYYEGRSGSTLDASSAIVFKDGRLFAAIYFSNTKTLKYFYQRCQLLRTVTSCDSSFCSAA